MSHYTEMTTALNANSETGFYAETMTRGSSKSADERAGVQTGSISVPPIRSIYGKMLAAQWLAD
jgi:hypothetical protein